MRLLIAILAALIAGYHFALGEPLDIQSKPISVFDRKAPEREVFGQLRFLGGLELTSTDARFGGISGMEIAGDGSLLLVTDKANLIAASPVRRDGRLVGLGRGVLNRLIDESHAPIYGTVDSESLTTLPGSDGAADTVVVSFERDHRLFRYSLDEEGRPVDIERLPLPEDAGDLPSNNGMEATVAMPPNGPLGGAFIVFAEGELPGHPGLAPGWVRHDDREYRIWLKREGGFAVTGAVALPDGDLIVLERLYIPLLGVSMALRHVQAEDIAPDAVIEGERLFVGSMEYEIDNMEGIAAWRDEAGRTILTLVSDDNFNALQRTLMLEFELIR